MGDSHDASCHTVYATTFRDRLLESKCDIEIVINLGTGVASAVLSMKNVLGGTAAFNISLDHLKALAKSIKELKTNVFLLDALPPEATDHQLNCECGGATMIVVQPKGTQARFTLSIGNYRREGKLSDLNAKDIDLAIDRITVRMDELIAKFKKNR